MVEIRAGLLLLMIAIDVPLHLLKIVVEHIEVTVAVKAVQVVPVE